MAADTATDTDDDTGVLDHLGLPPRVVALIHLHEQAHAHGTLDHLLDIMATDPAHYEALVDHVAAGELPDEEQDDSDGDQDDGDSDEPSEHD